MAAACKDEKATNMENSESMSTEPAIASDWLKCLKTSFGHSDFRSKQSEVIASILNERRDNCLFTSSGYGKSLTYQFPPVYTDSIAIVVNPFISLIHDQIREMRRNNVRACYMGSARKNQSTLIDVIEGRYNIVYVTPEYITRDPGKHLLNKIGEKITLIAIDEAHCISKWGHDFRPPYCELNQLRLLCPGVPIIALTATATPRVQEDIINGLTLHEPQIIRISVDRPNLYLSVKHKTAFNWTAMHDSQSGINKTKKLYDITSKIWKNVMLLDFAYTIWNDIGSHIREPTTGSIIVYCINSRMTEAVAGVIKRSGHECGIYNSEDPLHERIETQENFLLGRIRILCATVAFGLGISKPDVRLVILYGATSSLESFYQKAAAAGRDGLPAKCLMFYNDKDWSLHKFMRGNPNSPDKEEQSRQKRLMKLMMQYVLGNICRRRYILSYFGENCDQLQPRPDCCDVCNA